jgi:hypothetical protein
MGRMGNLASLCLVVFLASSCEDLRSTRKIKDEQRTPEQLCGNRVNLAWEPGLPTYDGAGNPIPVVGFNLYMGSSSGEYGLIPVATIQMTSPVDTHTFSLQGLGLGPYYIVATSYNGNGESPRSNEVVAQFSQCAQALGIRFNERGPKVLSIDEDI